MFDPQLECILRRPARRVNKASQPAFVCAVDATMDEVLALPVSRFRSAAADVLGLAGADGSDDHAYRSIWKQLCRFVDSRVGGGRVRASPRELLRLRDDLGGGSRVSTEIGGTAARIALSIASQGGEAYLVCTGGGEELVESARRMGSTLAGVFDLSAGEPSNSDLPRHVIIEMFDDDPTDRHVSDALGRISVEPDKGRDTSSERLTHALASALDASQAKQFVVVMSSVSAPVVERCIRSLPGAQRAIQYYLEIGEAIHSPQGQLQTSGDVTALRELGASTIVGMNEPAWRGLVGDPESAQFANAFASWNCSAMVLHREEEVACVSSGPNDHYLRCLKRGVALASLYAEQGQLPDAGAVQVRYEQLSGTSESVAGTAGLVTDLIISRATVPICRSPKRTVGLGDAFTAGFVTELGGEGSRSAKTFPGSTATPSRSEHRHGGD